MEDNWIGKAIIGLIIVSIIGAIWYGISQTGEDSRVVNIEVTDEDTYRGDKDARVTIVEYGDLQCPVCKTFATIANATLADYSSDQVRYVYRHFPLREIHPNAEIAAQAIEAAGEQGKFWEMKDVILQNQSEWANLDDPKPIFSGSYAKSLDLDLAEFDEDLLPEDDARERVEEDYQSGVELGISGTPTIIVNGQLIRTPRNAEEFRAIIDAELNK